MSSRHMEGKSMFARRMKQDHQVVLRALLVTINVNPCRLVRPPSGTQRPSCMHREGNPSVHPGLGCFHKGVIKGLRDKGFYNSNKRVTEVVVDCQI